MPKIVAVGEIGLDYHYNEDKDMQKDAFNLQINLANKYNLPIVIHTREAVMDTLEILKNNNVKNVGAPEPVRGTRNDSRNLKYIVKKIAEFKQESEEAIAKKSYENATRLFLSK